MQVLGQEEFSKAGCFVGVDSFCKKFWLPVEFPLPGGELRLSRVTYMTSGENLKNFLSWTILCKVEL